MDEVICGINYNVTKQYIEDNTIDLTVTSPPYDDARDYEGYSFEWEDFIKIRDELYRITKKGGVVVWIVGDMVNKKTHGKSGTSFKQCLSFMEKFILHDDMIFEKSAFSNPSANRYHQIKEYMFVFSKDGSPKTFNPIKDRKNKSKKGTSFGKQRRKKSGGFTNEDTKKRIVVNKKYGKRWNIWRYNTAKGKIAEEDYVQKKDVGHPAIFPEHLARDHIYSWSNEGDVVLDCFCGSGTTLKMAYLMNRKYIGIDCSQKYCDISIKRLKDNEGKQQSKLFWDTLLNPKEYRKNEKIDDFV